MSGQRSMRILAMALAVCAATGLSARAQVTTGTVTGTVKDVQGGVIPGATVTLINESQGTRSTPVVTNTTGDFVFATVQAGTYTIEVTMPSFKTLKRSGITVTAAERVSVGSLTIDVGGAQETVEVKGEAPIIQATTGDRSFAITTESVTNLPLASRSFTALALLAPGVTQDGNATPQRIGGGGDPNIMMDGVSTMDTGSNRPLLMMNVESIAEVKVLTSGYQAEYGRASGVQVTAVTKGGTNRFHGSLYDVEQNSDWNKNSKTNLLNGNPKTVFKQRNWGYSVGGPVGKPGANNKLFFFYAQEFSPLTQGNNVVNYRMPTALERSGDFSQTTDNNGNPYPYIKDPQLTGACTAANQTACFKDGGVLGKIPANRLYATGLAILNRLPLPNIANVPTGQNYNYTITEPNQSVLAWQPAVRIDYQPMTSLRTSFKYSAWKQRQQNFIGTIPGFNDTAMQNAPVVSYTGSVNYSVGPTMFLEGTFGHSQNELAGCAQAQSGTNSLVCNNGGGSQGVPMNPAASLSASGLNSLPFLFPDATVLNPGYYAVQALNQLQPAFWDASNLRMAKVPSFTFGGRIANAPPNTGFPGWFNINATNDVSISLTKVAGHHTMKTGFYNTHSYKAEQTSNNAFGSITFTETTPGTNPFDTSFGFANAAIGTFQSYTQAQKYVETNSVYNNTEWYVQDNWKVNRKLTLDYGLRFVRQQAQYDKLGQASNFLPTQWSLTAAPALYVPGCTIVVAAGTACPSANRQALNPLTGQFLGPNTTSAFGTLVPNTGNQLNGLFLPAGAPNASAADKAQGLPAATYTAPALEVAPRVGLAYDLSGKQTFVVRGGAGLYFDRPSSTTFSGGVNNPPTSGTITVQYSQLQSLGSAGLTTVGAPSLSAFPQNISLPLSLQWNTGVQMTLPGSSSLDLAYTGQHSWNGFVGTNVNAVDFGTYFLPSAQDTTLATSAIPGATALPQNLLRAIKGYGAITLQWQAGWRTYHSIQASFQRRFKNGVQFGFVDTVGLSDMANAGLRVQHNPDGSYSLRADQAQADALLGQQLGSSTSPVNTSRFNFVWALPHLRSTQPALRAVGLVINDWQLSGIWTGTTGTAYTIGFSYQNGGGNQNLTGSPDYGARIRVVGAPGHGCSSDTYRQFNTAAFQGPPVGTVGLDSGNSYIRGCYQSVLDLSIARNIRLGGGRQIQLRVDMFNAPNQAIINGRASTIMLSSPNDPITNVAPVFDPVTGLLNNGVNLTSTGALSPNRSQPKNAGFGVANSYQNARSIQAQVRFSF